MSNLSFEISPFTCRILQFCPRYYWDSSDCRCSRNHIQSRAHVRMMTHLIERLSTRRLHQGGRMDKKSTGDAPALELHGGEHLNTMIITLCNPAKSCVQQCCTHIMCLLQNMDNIRQSRVSCRIWIRVVTVRRST